MSQRGGKSKDRYGSTIRRSEYDDGILRNNARSDNRFRNDMLYHDRAQKVIMKELGKESLLLQSKLENDRKTVGLGLYGSRIGLPTNGSTPRKISGPITASVTPQPFRPAFLAQNNSRNEMVSQQQKFPWDKDTSDRDSGLGKDSSDQIASPISRARLRSSTSSFSSTRAPADDFLQSILNEAMNAELLYSQSQELTQTAVPETSSKTPRSALKKKSKTPRNSAMTVNSESRFSSLGNLQENGI